MYSWSAPLIGGGGSIEDVIYNENKRVQLPMGRQNLQALIRVGSDDEQWEVGGGDLKSW